MKATVVQIEDGIVYVKVRRNYRVETVYRRHYDLHVGDQIEVHRQANNPYLIRDDEKKLSAPF